MAIKRKDGSVYKLQGPNPIMLRQALGGEEPVIHNFVFPETVTAGHGPADEDYDEYRPAEVVTFPPPAKPAPRPEPKTEVAPEPPKPRAAPKSVPREPAWVLPATITEHRDPLYGEVRRQVRYGAKLRGEVIYAGGDDLGVNLWTNGAEVGRGLIIYLSNEQRWWRVDRVTPKADGWLYGCVPSDFQPAFD